MVSCLLFWYQNFFFPSRKKICLGFCTFVVTIIWHFAWSYFAWFFCFSSICFFPTQPPPHVDEEGLWLIYTTFENALDIIVSKINPETLQITEESISEKQYSHHANKHTQYATYKTNWKKLWSGNAFTACGVLYTLQKFDAKKTGLNYIYDMHSRSFKHFKIPMVSKHKWISSLSYNYKTQQLYAWDKSYLVTYDVVFYDHDDRAYFGLAGFGGFFFLRKKYFSAPSSGPLVLFLSQKIPFSLRFRCTRGHLKITFFNARLIMKIKWIYLDLSFSWWRPRLF